MAQGTARVYITGDASSIKKAMEEAGLYAEAASVKIASSGKKVEGSWLGMSGAGKNAAKEIEASTGRIGAAFAGIASSGNIAIAAVVGIGVAVAGIKKSVDTFDELAKVTRTLHNATGLSTESASKYAAIAKVTGLQTTGLTQAFGTLSKNVQAVTNAQEGLSKGGKTQELVFNKLGISAKTLTANHHDMNKILPLVLDKFEKMKGSTEKTAIGMALFGRGWKTLVPLLHEGALGMKELEDEAKAMGVTLGGDAAKNATKMAQAHEKLKFAMLGLEVAIAEKLLPALASLAGTFAHVVSEMRTGSGSIGKAWKVASDIITTTIQVNLLLFTSFIKTVGAVAGAAKAAFGGIVSAVTSAANALKSVFNTFYDIGKYLIDGLVKGIESAAMAPIHAIEGIAKGVSDVASKVLSIGSPSKVFERHGEAVSEGFAVGISRGSAKVLAASASMAHAASGGFSAAAGTNYSAGKESTIAQRLAAMGRALGINLTGISGYRTPQHSVEVGGFANDPHTRGEASDTEGAQRISEKILEKFGLTRPFAGAKEANHIQLLAGSSAAAVHVASQTLSGKVSWFGGPNDPEDSGHTADGQTTATPGIAVYNRSTLGGYWRVKLPNGKTAVLKQTDIGPAPWTGRKIDFTYSALKQLGYNEHNFPTDSTASAEYLGKNPNVKNAVQGYAGAIVTAATKLVLNAAQGNAIAKYTGAAETAASAAASWKEAGAALTSHGSALTSRESALHFNLATPAGLHSAAVGRGNQVERDTAEKVFLARELKALQNEATNWARKRDVYLRAARGSHGKAKKEAIEKAAECQAKVETAKKDAEACKGSIYAAETKQIEDKASVAALPGEAQEADLNAYQEANAHVDLQVRAGVLTAAQGKAAKEANANKAIAGGFGALSENGMLTVRGDLREFSEGLNEGTNALQAHTEALKGATDALNEFTSAGNNIARVESGSLAKGLADVVSGQIAGVGYQGRRSAAGAGSAARY